MKYTNKYNLPDAMASALSSDRYSQPGRISVTGLISPPRIFQLKQRHRDELEEDVSERVWTLLGSAIHDVLDRADTDGIQETRLSAEILGWEVTGQADLWEAPGTLSDYKITSVWSVIRGIKPEWAAQLNCYAYLYRRCLGKPVIKLQIVAILKDHSRGRAKQGGDYPPIPAMVLDVPVWPDERVEKYIEGRVQAHQEAEKLLDAELPLCTPEERWDRPTTWAVMKKGRKSAVRVLDNAEAAEAMAAEKGSGHSVVERPGTSTRCENYCPVAEFCDYGRKIKGGE